MTQSSKLNLVIDTNVLLVSIPSSSAHHWFYLALINKQFNAFITTEILSEYEEVIGKRLSSPVASSVIRTLIELDNVVPITAYFKYQLIQSDPDDDKFVNCAISANAHYIVTHDRHFDILRTIDFPKIKTATLPEIKEIMIQRL